MEGHFSEDKDDIKSLIEKPIINKNILRRVVYFSFDIEPGGKTCEIVKISARKFRLIRNHGKMERYR